MGMSAPAAHVAEAWQSAEFWTNKIRTQHKATNPEHVAWVDALRDLVARDVREYVKTHHPAGPAWNPKGGDVKTYEASGAGATTAAPSPAAPPPPPPPPPSSSSPPPPPSLPRRRPPGRRRPPSRA